MNLNRNHSPNAYLSHHMQCNLNQIFLVYKLAYGHKLEFYADFYVQWNLTHILRKQDSMYATELSTCLPFLFTQSQENSILKSVSIFIPSTFVLLFCVVLHKSQQIRLSDIYKYKYKNFVDVIFNILHLLLIYLDSKRFNSSLYFSFLNS